MNAKAFVGFLCAMITIIDIIMQVLERVGILNLICQFQYGIDGVHVAVGSRHNDRVR